MNPFKYALRNIFRLTRSSVALFSVLFILSCLSVIFLCVKNGATTEAERLKIEYSVIAEIENKSDNDSGGIISKGKPLFKEDLEKLINSPYTKNFTATVFTTISGSDDFLLYDNVVSYLDLSEDSYFIENNDTIFKDFRIYGVEGFENISGTKITEGRAFNEFEYAEGAASVILQKEFAIEKGYKPGDNFVIGRLGKETLEWNKQWDGITGVRDDIFEFTVVGIYETQIENIVNYTSVIYTPLKTAYKIENSLYDGNYWEQVKAMKRYDPTVSLGNIQFILNNPKNGEAFIKYASETGFDLQNYMITVKDSDYKLMTKPLVSIIKMADILTVAIVPTGCAILFFIMWLLMNSRKKEAGLLFALGCGKRRAAICFGAETVIITVFALTVGCLIGLYSSEIIADKILEDKINQYEAIMTKDDADLIYGENAEKIFENISVKLSLEAKTADTVLVAATAFIIVIIANILFLLKIMKIEPAIMLKN